MPQFSLDPLQPGSIVSTPTGTPYGGTIYPAGTLVVNPYSASVKPGGKGGKHKKHGKGAGTAPTTGTSPSSGSSSSTASTPTNNGKHGNKGGKGNGNNASTNTVDPNNPLTSAFLTPSQLRDQAANLAALSVPTEQSLRDAAARQQAGLGGLTNALTGTLTGLADRTQAGLAGFGNLYSQLANTAQSSGQSAAAAAGAPTSGVPGGSATMASNLANLAAPSMGYAPAAAVTGAQMQGAVAANLTKALMDRSSTLSADTAKYLQQLQQQEYQKATGQQTIQQNAALLGLKQDTLQASNAYHQGMLQNAADSNQIRLMQLQRQTKNDLLKYGATSLKSLTAAQNRILSQQQSLVGYTDQPVAGMNAYSVQVQDPITQSISSKTVYGPDPASAVKNAGVQITGTPVYTGPQMVKQPPNKQQLVNSLASQLVNASKGTAHPWSMAKAQQWVLSHATSIAQLP